LDLDFGFWILDFGFWILDFGFWILDFDVTFMEMHIEEDNMTSQGVNGRICRVKNTWQTVWTEGLIMSLTLNLNSTLTLTLTLTLILILISILTFQVLKEVFVVKGRRGT
jgi:hypothetical protein